MYDTTKIWTIKCMHNYYYLLIIHFQGSSHILFCIFKIPWENIYAAASGHSVHGSIVCVKGRRVRGRYIPPFYARAPFSNTQSQYTASLLKIIRPNNTFSMTNIKVVNAYSKNMYYVLYIIIGIGHIIYII